MFDFFLDKKEYVSCEWLEYGIHFSHEGLFHCCSFSHNEENRKPVSCILPDDTYDFKNFFIEKKKIRKNQRKGIIDKDCKGCFLLKKGRWSKENKIKMMAICANTKCNSDCVYCYTHSNKEFYNSRPDIPILDFIKKNVKNGRIAKDCEFGFGGGEPTVSSEFNDILHLLLDNGYSNFKIHSSAIKYSKAIERAMSLDVCNLVISIDAGNKDLYKKIKNVDAYDKCWENIRKYAQAQNKIKDKLHVKYIIIPSYNDDKDNIKMFLEEALKNGVKHVLVDIDIDWYKMKKKNVEEVKRLFELVKYFEKYAEKIGLTQSHFPTVCTAVGDYHALYDSIQVSL